MFLKELKNNKKILAKNYKSVYNTNGKGFNLCIESNPIETYEPCQVRKEAAISRKSLCGVLSIERLVSHHFLRYKGCEIYGIHSSL